MFNVELICFLVSINEMDYIYNEFLVDCNLFEMFVWDFEIFEVVFRIKFMIVGCLFVVFVIFSEDEYGDEEDVGGKSEFIDFLSMVFSGMDLLFFIWV